MALVTGGLMNKQVAAEIGVTEVTVKVHRGNVTRKMGAKSLAELVRMADVLNVRRITRSGLYASLRIVAALVLAGSILIDLCSARRLLGNVN